MLPPPSLTTEATTPSTARRQTLARSGTSRQKSRNLRCNRPPSATQPETSLLATNSLSLRLFLFQCCPSSYDSDSRRN
ncbi:hypothetical protein U1Q18_035885 [Sarracenia purpurea var. burkii]